MDTPEKPKRSWWRNWWAPFAIAAGAVCVAMSITSAEIVSDVWLEKNNRPDIPDGFGISVAYLNWAVATLGAMASGLLTSGTTKRRVLVSLVFGGIGFIVYIAATFCIVFAFLYLMAPDSLGL